MIFDKAKCDECLNEFSLNNGGFSVIVEKREGLVTLTFFEAGTTGLGLSKEVCGLECACKLLSRELSEIKGASND